MRIGARKMLAAIDLFRESCEKDEVPNSGIVGLHDRALSHLFGALAADDPRQGVRVSARRLARELRRHAARLAGSECHVHAFSVDEVNRLRERARAAVAGDHVGPPGWSRSSADPMALLDVFGSIRLRPGWVLRAYQYTEGDDGNGLVWALPRDAPFPEPDDCMGSDSDGSAPHPMPPGGIADVGSLIDGDGSPLSYLSASLLARELTEFGARGRGRSWSDECIIGAPPPAPGGAPVGRNVFIARLLSQQWTWYDALPQEGDWLPRVRQGPGQLEQGLATLGDYGKLVHELRALERGQQPVSVAFLVHTEMGRPRIGRDEDVYTSEGYAAVDYSATLAEAPEPGAD